MTMSGELQDVGRLWPTEAFNQHSGAGEGVHELLSAWEDDFYGALPAAEDADADRTAIAFKLDLISDHRHGHMEPPKGRIARTFFLCSAFCPIRQGHPARSTSSQNRHVRLEPENYRRTTSRSGEALREPRDLIIPLLTAGLAPSNPRSSAYGPTRIAPHSLATASGSQLVYSGATAAPVPGVVAHQILGGVP